MTTFVRYAAPYNNTSTAAAAAAAADIAAERTLPANGTSLDSVNLAVARGYPASISNIGFAKVREYEVTFSPAAVTAGPGQRLVTTIAVADLVRLFTIPANHVVLACRLEVLTAGTTSLATFAMTDGTNTLIPATLLTTKGTQGVGVTPRVYTSDTPVSLVAAGASTTDGTYRVVVLAMDMTGQDTTSLISG